MIVKKAREVVQLNWIKFPLLIYLFCATVPALAGDYPFSVKIQKSGQVANLVAVNEGFAPVFASISLMTAENIASDQKWPINQVIPAQSTVFIASLHPANQEEASSFTYQTNSNIGDPQASQNPDFAYRIPINDGLKAQIVQAFGGNITTHSEPDSIYAVDIEMPRGTTVVAARSGIVIDDEYRYGEGKKEDSYKDQTNYIRIMHDDGTFAIYAHLQQGGIYVTPGQQVLEGQMIALSGNSGYSSGPHLHFAIEKNTGLSMVSLPFYFYTKRQGRFIPKVGMILNADYSEK